VSHFDDPVHVQRYAEGPGRFVPGYKAMQQMAAQLLAETAGQGAEILVLGAGGGLEIEAFAAAQPSWRFTGLDPSVEMLKQAKRVVGAAGAADRVRWVHGYIPDAPEGPFDGASCLLTLHFLPDDGEKLAALRIIRDRLKPGGRFVVADLCLDKQADDYEMRLGRYGRFAVDSGADAQDVAETQQRVSNVLHSVPPTREEALLAEAGFLYIDLFYAGLSWRGWSALA
jgi:tRNA (cmo5U34)-methyltransferase